MLFPFYKIILLVSVTADVCELWQLNPRAHALVGADVGISHFTNMGIGSQRL